MRRKPITIAIAGPGSNSGKTHLACALIRYLEKSTQVGAVKIATATPDHRCARTMLPCDCLRFEGRMRLTTNPEYINKTGKDTAAMHDAGAQPVWWLQTTSDVSLESAEFLKGELDKTEIPCWVIEGSGPIRAQFADLNILVAKADGSPPKASWFELKPHAHVIALSHAAEINSTDHQAVLKQLDTLVPVIDFDSRAPELNPQFREFLDRFLQGHPQAKHA